MVCALRRVVARLRISYDLRSRSEVADSTRSAELGIELGVEVGLEARVQLRLE